MNLNAPKPASKSIFRLQQLSTDGHYLFAEGKNRKLRLNGQPLDARAHSLVKFENIDPLAETHCKGKEVSLTFEPAFISIKQYTPKGSDSPIWIPDTGLWTPSESRPLEATITLHQQGEIVAFELEGLTVLQRHWELQLLERLEDPSAQNDFGLSSVREVIDLKLGYLAFLTVSLTDTKDPLFQEPLYDISGTQLKVDDRAVLVVARSDISDGDVVSYVIENSADSGSGEHSQNVPNTRSKTKDQKQ